MAAFSLKPKLTALGLGAKRQPIVDEATVVAAAPNNGAASFAAADDDDDGSSFIKGDADTDTEEAACDWLIKVGI